MQGYQFAHMEIWSRAGAPEGKDSTSKVRRNGQRAWTVSEIIDEAERVPSASEHVRNCDYNPQIIAGTCSSFSELRDAHDTACSVKQAFPYTDKNGQRKTRRRKLRKDSNTLFTAIISLPVMSESAQADPNIMQECQEVFQRAIAFEKCRIEDDGGEFAMAVVHLDEKHVHMHIFGLDRARGVVNNLHPGRAAQDTYRKRNAREGKLGVNLYNRTRRVYNDAMREWQDDLHRDVFCPAGLLRYGPRRARYSRAEYLKRKCEEEERAKALDTIKSIHATVDSLQNVCESFSEVNKTQEKLASLSEECETKRDEFDAAVRKRFDMQNEQALELAEAEKNQRKVSAELSRREKAVADNEHRLAEERRAVAVDRHAVNADKAAAERLREENQKLGIEYEAGIATFEAMAEGMLEIDPTNGRVTGRLTDAGQQHPRRGIIVKAIESAPHQFRAVGDKLAALILSIRRNAAAAGRADAEKKARDEIIREHSGLGAVYEFTRKLIGRFPYKDQRDAATAELNAAAAKNEPDIKKLRRSRGRDDDVR